MVQGCFTDTRGFWGRQCQTSLPLNKREWIFVKIKEGFQLKLLCICWQKTTNLGLSSPSRSLLLAGGDQHGLEMVCCYSWNSSPAPPADPYFSWSKPSPNNMHIPTHAGRLFLLLLLHPRGPPLGWSFSLTLAARCPTEVLSILSFGNELHLLSSVLNHPPAVFIAVTVLTQKRYWVHLWCSGFSGLY